MVVRVGAVQKAVLGATVLLVANKAKFVAASYRTIRRCVCVIFPFKTSNVCVGGYKKQSKGYLCTMWKRLAESLLAQFSQESFQGKIRKDTFLF